MLRGLIPIVTPEMGVDVDKVGAIFEGCSLKAIREQAVRISSLSGGELRKRSKVIRDRATQLHTLSVDRTAIEAALNYVLKG
ncbi:MAG: hypothetical protein ACYTEQ_09875 [Planctomycetota bacterium]|jgi:hypothetical protein